MIRAALLCMLLAACVSTPSLPELRANALRLEFSDGICSGTAIAPDTILTAAHCLAMGAELVSANGIPVKVAEVTPLAKDVVSVRIEGKPFKHWASHWGHAVQGERIRFFGNPLGEPDVYREGIVVRARANQIIVQATICHGDSGAGAYDDQGRIVGVVSAMTANVPCDFLVAQPWG